MNFADRLCKAVEDKRNPSCVGLDPRIENIPKKFKDRAVEKHGDTAEAAANAFLDFGVEVIDAIADVVPVVKPQSAFYEAYGPAGIRALSETIDHARKKGLIVIEDVKRGDIGTTAEAYAAAHLGESILCGGGKARCMAADAVTVNPYLGSDGVRPFLALDGKGVFILVKTSNKSSVELQDQKLATGKALYEQVASLVTEWGKPLVGKRGWSSVGAVAGATFPEEVKKLRMAMPQSPFLVPGYGAQGGGAADVVHAFDKDGLGAVVNSSRGIIFAHEKSQLPFGDAVRKAADDMKNDLRSALSAAGKWPF
jgi:orotidine-5'-phosphate decarboxylase